MARAFLIVLDSAGCGGAPDAHLFFNGARSDTGANTLGHIALACHEGRAEEGRSGPIHLPTLMSLGLARSVELASGLAIPGGEPNPTGLWGAATEVSMGKDTPTGHWELSGVPVPWEWHYFPDTTPAFPQEVTAALCYAAGTEGILGNCHASGTAIIDTLGGEHLRTSWPICYTSVDSVLQIAAHEEHFGLERLLKLCADVAPMLHEMRVGRVIARPFTGAEDSGFKRTVNRKDFAMAPPAPTLCDWVQQAGGRVIAIGKIGDIFSMRGIDQSHKGRDADLMDHLENCIRDAPEQSLTFANFVEFDSQYGHRRDISGYAAHLEWFDARLASALGHLREGDMLVVTADHGNDPSWTGTDHTRERVPVLVAGAGAGELGLIGFSDVAGLIADHLGVHRPEEAA